LPWIEGAKKEPEKAISLNPKKSDPVPTEISKRTACRIKDQDQVLPYSTTSSKADETHEDGEYA